MSLIAPTLPGAVRRCRRQQQPVPPRLATPAPSTARSAPRPPAGATSATRFPTLLVAPAPPRPRDRYRDGCRRAPRRGRGGLSGGGGLLRVVGVDLLPEAPERGLVDAGGRFDGGPGHLLAQQPLDGDHLASQLTLPATFRPALRMTPGMAPAALRSQQRVVVRPGAFPLTQRRSHPLQHRARPRREPLLVQRRVYLLRRPSRKRSARTRLPVPRGPGVT